MAKELLAKNLTIRFGGHTAVDAVTCRFNPGELTAIVGPNGAGKTTLFNLLSGQLFPSTGQILLDQEDITGLSVAKRANLGIGRAFQLTNLFPKLTVEENLHLVVQARHKRGLSMLSVARRNFDLFAEVDRLLKKCDLVSRRIEQVSALPHGEQRKLEVAMLVAMEPDVYMFDEPTAGMSGDGIPAVLGLIEQIRQDATKIVLLVEHKLDVIKTLADRIIVLHDGALVADGKPEEVMSLPVVRSVYLGEQLTANA